MKHPLDGVIIIEFEGLGPAPFAAMTLSGMGAKVIRIARKIPKSDSGWLDRDREYCVLDLKSDAGRGAALDLIARADVVIEGFRPGKMEALGLGPGEAFAVNPNLVYGRMTGWGQTGPMVHLAGHDLNFLAMTGLLPLMGHLDRPPTPPLNLVSDFGGGGMYLALGIVSALVKARATGQGTVVDAAMVHGTSHLATFVHGQLASGAWHAQREANMLDGGAPFYRVYTCADGGWMAMAAIESQFWAKALTVLGFEADTQLRQWDRSDWHHQIEFIAARFSEHDRAHWEAAFDGIDACVTPVLSMTEAKSHPQVAQYFETIAENARPIAAPLFKENQRA